MAAAFNNRTSGNLQNTVRNLYYRRRKVGALALTHEEYINTFVPFGVRQLFREITPFTARDFRINRWELALPDGVGSIKNILKTTLQICSDETGRPTPPVVHEFIIQPDAPQEICNRIYQWAETNGDVSRDFARVAKVLEILNAAYSRVAIRYYWPTILALCSESPLTEVKELVKEMQELRMPAKLKPLPPGLQQACRLAAETIATTRLLPEDVGETKGEVLIGIVPGQTYTEVGVGTFYGMA